LKTSEYCHVGEGVLIYSKNRHMIFERSLNKQMQVQGDCEVTVVFVSAVTFKNNT